MNKLKICYIYTFSKYHKKHQKLQIIKNNCPSTFQYKTFYLNCYVYFLRYHKKQ